MGQILAYVLVGAQLDSLMGTEYVRDAVCIGFICNDDGDGLVGGHELGLHLDATGDERLVALDVLGGGVGALGELDAVLLDDAYSYFF